MLSRIHVACHAQRHARCMLEYVCGAEGQLCRIHNVLRAASNIVLGLQLCLNMHFSLVSPHLNQWLKFRHTVHA